MRRGGWKHRFMPTAIEIDERNQLRIGVSSNDGKDYLVIAPWVRYANTMEKSEGKEPSWRPKVGEKGDGKTITMPIENLQDIISALKGVAEEYAESLLESISLP